MFLKHYKDIRQDTCHKLVKNFALKNLFLSAKTKSTDYLETVLKLKLEVISRRLNKKIDGYFRI